MTARGIRRLLPSLFRGLFNDSRGDLNTHLLLTGAGCVMVGLCVPSLMNSSQRASDTFERQVAVLENGASPGGAGGSAVGASGLSGIASQVGGIASTIGGIASQVTSVVSAAKSGNVAGVANGVAGVANVIGNQGASTGTVVPVQVGTGVSTGGITAAQAAETTRISQAILAARTN